MSQRVAAILFAIGALAVAGAALLFVSTSTLGDNIVYYWSPTELVAKGLLPGEATVRLGGQVVPGTLHWTPGQPGRFQVTDGATVVDVAVTGVPPQMFREGIGVVVEGTWAADGVFHTDRVMVKHSNEYRAPDDTTHDAKQVYQTLVTEES